MRRGVNRWRAGESHSSVSDSRPCVKGLPDPYEMGAEITALRRRVRELLEKDNELLGLASAFFASGDHNTSAAN